ncbi:MAG: plastocyanin/azurin family copper-binding protein [Thermoanaerobaculia bacterium]
MHWPPTLPKHTARWLAVILLAVACGGGGGSSPTEPPPPPPPGGGVTIVRIVDNAFQPVSATIAPGDTVRWVLEQGSMTNHTTTEVNGRWDSGFVFTSAGATFERTFPANENGQTLLYRCLTHVALGMQGSVRVGTNSPPPPPGYE